MGPNRKIACQDLPKIELHVHLDTSLSYPNILALRPGLTLENYNQEYVAPAQCRDLTDFLRYPSSAIALLQTRENLRSALCQLVREMAADGVIYTELRFAPLLHTDQGLQPKEVVDVVCQAAREAEGETGVVTRLILCTLRHFVEAQSLETADLVIAFRDQGVVGLDLAADEGYSLNAHISAFRKVIEAGMACTAHAGEARGPESVRETLELLCPRRIGHGVRSVEDAALVAALARQGVHLEVCPSSNLQTGVFSTMADHSIDQLYRNGISVSVNTDGRGLTQTTLSREYELVHQAFGWTLPDFLNVNRMAVEAAFISEEIKTDLRHKLDVGYQQALD